MGSGSERLIKQVVGEYEKRLKGVNRKLEELEKNQQVIKAALEQNTEVFAGGFERVDGWVYVLQRVLNDMTRGTVHVLNYTPEDEDSILEAEVDYEWYFRQYYGCYGFFAFIELLSESTEPLGVPETQHEDPETVVFGGDYGTPPH
jgi:hypothetical protein